MVVFFYRVSSISKVGSHCLFELQSSIALFAMYHLIFWKLTYFMQLYVGFLHSYLVYASLYCISYKNTKFYKFIIY